MDTITDIPSYYRNTDTFKDYFIDGEITFEEFKESKLFGFIRDDSPIVDNEDFLFTLKSLDYYLVEILPDFVIDYIKKNPQPIKTDYVYKDLWNKQIISKLNLINLFNCEDRELINEFILNSNSKFSLGMLHLALIDENGYINVLSVKNLQDNKCSIIPGGKFIAVSSGLYHTSAIRQDGTIETWGDNTYQQCNNIPSGKFIFISSGPYHTSGIREDGTVVTWGCNKYKQYNKLPKGRFLSISSGNNHTSGIREDGTVVTWGDHRNQQYDNLPEGRFIAISSGEFHTSCIREDRTVITWGNIFFNQYNNLPDGRFISISSGGAHTAGIREDGTVVTWGNNHNYQCRDILNENFIAISCGFSHTAAIKKDGTLITWRSNVLESKKIVKISSYYKTIAMLDEDGNVNFTEFP